MWLPGYVPLASYSSNEWLLASRGLSPFRRALSRHRLANLHDIYGKTSGEAWLKLKAFLAEATANGLGKMKIKGYNTHNCSLQRTEYFGIKEVHRER